MTDCHVKYKLTTTSIVLKVALFFSDDMVLNLLWYLKTCIVRETCQKTWSFLSKDLSFLSIDLRFFLCRLNSTLEHFLCFAGFPNTQVVEAYLSPTVDDSKEKFSWSLPDLQELRLYPFC